MRRRKGVAQPRAQPELFFADIELNVETREVWKNDAPVQLSPTEFTLLHYFMSNPRKVLSKRAILDHLLQRRQPGPGHRRRAGLHPRGR